MMVKKFDRLGRNTIAFDDFIQCCVVRIDADKMKAFSNMIL
jgi:hypothetical protein